MPACSIITPLERSYRCVDDIGQASCLRATRKRSRLGDNRAGLIITRDFEHPPTVKAERSARAGVLRRQLAGPASEPSGCPQLFIWSRGVYASVCGA
jgi:hypothetical protein